MLINTIPKGKGVRKLTLDDILPDCDIFINKNIYTLKELTIGKKVADIGCGYGHNKEVVESNGGTWIGIEPFEGGAHTVIASAEDLPFEDNSFDVVIMDAVLEHIPDVGAAFKEVGRILKPNGLFVGYVAFMECFHEISYSHLSFKAMEYYSKLNGMKLEKIAGGSRFGIDYHLHVIFYPIPFNFMRRVIAMFIRGIFKYKSFMMYWYWRTVKKIDTNGSSIKAKKYYLSECLRQSNGFNFVIRKKAL